MAGSMGTMAGVRSVKALSLVFILIPLLAAAGCVRQNAGSGPITVSADVAEGYRKYLTRYNAGRFYVSEDGQCYLFTHCPSGMCRLDQTEASTIRECSEDCGSPCKLLAVNKTVVWLGPVTGIEIGKVGVFTVSWDGYIDRFQGLGKLDPDGESAIIEIDNAQGLGFCRGKIVKEGKRSGIWLISCSEGQTATGKVRFYLEEVYPDDQFFQLNHRNAFSFYRNSYRGVWRVSGAGTDGDERNVWFLLDELTDWADTGEIKSDPPGQIASAQVKPGATIKDCPFCPEMITVPAGSFIMGSANGNPNEWPTREIQVAKPFAIGRHEVTFDEWDACTTDGKCKRLDDAGWGRGRRPAINLNWDDAQDYVDWLSQKTGKIYRLLTEAEYEYAARAGSSTVYPWGDRFDGSKTNVYARKTSSVGRFPPNAYGLHDTNGNVWEWVSDCYGLYQPNQSDSHHSAGGCDRYQYPARVIRGGFWEGSQETARSSKRGSRTPDTEMNFIGLRVARDLD